MDPPPRQAVAPAAPQHEVVVVVDDDIVASDGFPPPSSLVTTLRPSSPPSSGVASQRTPPPTTEGGVDLLSVAGEEGKSFHAAISNASPSDVTMPNLTGAAPQRQEDDVDGWTRPPEAPSSDGTSRAAAELAGLLEKFEHFKHAFFALQGQCGQAIARIQREKEVTDRRREGCARSAAQLRALGPRRVRLNVGGVLFEVSEALLRQYPGTFFTVLLDGHFSVDTDDSGAIFIDRDPVVFRDILYFLRTGQVPTAPSRLCVRCAALDQAASGSPPLSTPHGSFLHTTDPAAANGRLGVSQSAALAGGAVGPTIAAGANAAAQAEDGTTTTRGRGTGHVAAGAGAAAITTTTTNTNAGHHLGPASGGCGPAYDLAAEFRLLEDEAQFYGLHELVMLLTADRGVWHRQGQDHLVEGSVPSPRCFSAAVATDYDTVYVFGGCTAEDKFFDSLYELTVSDATHEQLLLQQQQQQQQGGGGNASSPQASRSPTAAGTPAPTSQPMGGANTAVAGGGGGGAYPSSSSPPSPTPPAAAAAGSSHASSSANHRRHTIVDRFTWRRVKPRYGSPPAPRSGHTLCRVGGHLLVIGGNNSLEMEPVAHAFDIHAGGWSPVSFAGEVTVGPRSGHTVTVVDGRLYLIGGKQIFPTQSTFRDVLVGDFIAASNQIVWRYAPLVDGNHTTTTAGFNRHPSVSPSARATATARPATATAAAGSGGALSSANLPTGNPSSAPGPTQTYVSASSATTTVGHPHHQQQRGSGTAYRGVEERAYHSAVEYKGTIFVFGGIVDSVYCRDLCTYNTHTGVWTKVTPDSHPGYVHPRPRSGHVAVVFGQDMVVLGSYSEDSPHMALLAMDLETYEWRTVQTTGAAPLRRAAPSGVVLPSDRIRGRMERLLVFGGFDIAQRKCFNELHVITI